MALSVSTASAVVIDFEGADASPTQPIPLTSLVEDGFSFSIASDLSDDAGAGVFDTRCTPGSCNDDEDLKPLPQPPNAVDFVGVAGNVLITQENGSPIPDDVGFGSSLITFTSDAGNKPFRLTGFSAIDDGDFHLFLGTAGALGPLLATISNAADNDAGTASFLSATIFPGDSFTFGFDGSGGVDGVSLQVVPVPASLALLGAALAGLGLVARRRAA